MERNECLPKRLVPEGSVSGNPANLASSSTNPIHGFTAHHEAIGVGEESNITLFHALSEESAKQLQLANRGVVRTAQTTRFTAEASPATLTAQRRRIRLGHGEAPKDRLAAGPIVYPSSAP